MKKPPFFQMSSSFFGWVSNWCRYMVHRSQETKQNKWSELFYTCRTALRTPAGLGVAEFLLPILILDCLCCGNQSDEQILLREIKDALTFGVNENSFDFCMSKTDRQKAVSVLFNVMDQLQFWSETEAETLYRTGRRSVTYFFDRRYNLSEDEWPVEKSLSRIDDFLKEISLELRANAASKVGMYAYALRLTEMATRSTVAHRVFDTNTSIETPKNRSRASGSCPENQLSFMKDVLASLNDYETMVAMGKDDYWSNPSTRVLDSIRENEAVGDWEAALQDYERAQQLNGHTPTLQLGSLRCLLNLGHFESTLQHVNGIIYNANSKKASELCNPDDTVPVAVEAAWRLGRWETLADLVHKKSEVCLDSYEVNLGEAMLNLHLKKSEEVKKYVNQAKQVLVTGLSSVARESYSRAYHHIVRLQALREIEDVAESICTANPPRLGDIVCDSNFCWNTRLDILSSSGAHTVLNTRLALGRLADDHAFEGAIFLNMGKRARKKGLHGIAANAFAQSEAALTKLTSQDKDVLANSLRLQIAKLKHCCGESNTALRMLGQDRLWDDLSKSIAHLRVPTSASHTIPVTKQRTTESEVQEMVVKSALQSTRWMIEGGLKGGVEVMHQFEIIHTAAPKWEKGIAFFFTLFVFSKNIFVNKSHLLFFRKGHFQYAKYIDSVLRSRIQALEKRSADRFGGEHQDKSKSRATSHDKASQKYVLLAMKHLSLALSFDIKHVYQALPRLLSLWFDFTSIKEDVHDSQGNDLRSQAEQEAWSTFRLTLCQIIYVKSDSLTRFSFFPDADDLGRNQEKANTIMAESYKQIPAHAFYTAIPQLISRIIHVDVSINFVLWI